MGDVEGVPNGAIEKGIKEFQSYKHDERNGFKENGVLGGEQLRFLKEYESKSIDEAKNVKFEAHGVIASENHIGSQNEPLSQVVRWERFLPFQSLKVLLVENDDSTRQVVGALLRNCGYEVSNATNGVQAWKILEDLTVRIDLVLTEAAMPFLSGIGLLCKIMSHKTRKNIPVIMMSSVDSMNLVFQCLSKGAADFLFKPVRKNELKNLWQHVWRRCHSSSGSASESVVPKSKSVGESDNNTSSNDENDNASIGLNLRDRSDNGSGTQSSWTKRAVKVESPQPMSPWKLLAEAHDSTCAQVIYPRPEISGNDRVVMGFKRNITETKEFLDPVVMGRREMEIKLPPNSDLQHQTSPWEVTPVKLSGLKHNKLLSEGLKKDKDTMSCVVLCNDAANHCAEDRLQVDDKIGIGASSDTEIHLGVGPSETFTGPSIISNVRDKHVSDAKDLSSLDQNLKRLRSIEDDGNPHKDVRNVLRLSDQSAFSRYITTNSTTQGATGYGGSCSTPPINDDNNSEAIKQESTYNLASNSGATPINQGSNCSSNNNDMESTTKDFTKPTSVKDKLSSMADSACAVQKSSAFHQLRHWHSCPSQQIAPEKVSDIALVAVGQAIGSHHQVQVQHHHYHYHHHHHRHHVHNLPQPSSSFLGHENLNQNSMVVATPQCDSSNAIGGPVENNGNYSINGSVSGSNHGSNGQNGSSTAAKDGATNVESDNGTGVKSGADGGSGTVHGSGIEQNRSAQREAALTKFRQKRKERCYEKKVRYQTRKKLAEQRPRVRGQFVRQTTQGPKSEDADS